MLCVLENKTFCSAIAREAQQITGSMTSCSVEKRFKQCKDYEQRQQEWNESKQKRKKYKRSLISIAEMDGSEVDIEKECHMTIIGWHHKGNDCAEISPNFHVAGQENDPFP